MLARLGRTFLVVALLLAQHAAIAHQLQHAAGVPQEDSILCESHDLLGTVLGVAAATLPSEPLLLLVDVRIGRSTSPAAPRHSVAPKSRGPPLIS
jgi:hypothetical protein